MLDKRKLIIILASGSPRRRMLLAREGYDFEVITADVDEREAAYTDVAEIVVQNAEIKARPVVDLLKQRRPQDDRRRIVLAADTLVAKDQTVYGKPKSMAQALDFMRELTLGPHQVLTGVHLHDPDLGVSRSFCDITDVTLKPMDDSAITALFRKVPPLDKAGAYGYQDSPEIVDSLMGDETTVIGLPMKRLATELAAMLT